jgi:TrmH family RNA methyltransferase
VKAITSRQNPLVAEFRSAARQRNKDRQHLLLDGARLIDDARAAGLVIDTALLSAAALRTEDPDMKRLADALAASGADVFAASESVLAAASPVRAPSGAVALATHRPHAPEQIMDDLRRGLVVGAVGVQDPGNVGAIVRAADAGGARAVIVTGGSADPFGWRALRGAMGSSFRLPVTAIDDITPLVEDVRARGIPVVAAVPRGGTGMYEADLTGPRLVLLGQEGAGLSQDVGVNADVSVSVPMRREVDSLNVAVAAALIIYEARRQSLRRRRGAKVSGRSSRRSVRRTTP